MYCIFFKRKRTFYRFLYFISILIVFIANYYINSNGQDAKAEGEHDTENQRHDNAQKQDERNQKEEDFANDNIEVPDIDLDDGYDEDKLDVSRDTFMLRKARYIAYKKRGPRTGIGENGVPAVLSRKDERRAKAAFMNARFNIVASDLISMDRSVPDTRPSE